MKKAATPEVNEVLYWARNRGGRIIEKDQADEDGHIGRWKSMLGEVAPVPAKA